MTWFDDLVEDAMPYLATEELSGTAGASWQWTYTLDDDAADLGAAYSGTCVIKSSPADLASIVAVAVTFPTVNQIRCTVTAGESAVLAEGQYRHEVTITRVSDSHSLRVVGGGDSSFTVKPRWGVGAVAVTVPGEVAAFTATPGNSVIDLAWDAPSSPGGSAVTGYDYRGDASGVVTHVSAATVTGQLTGVLNGTSYTVSVRAVNAIGPGPWRYATVVPGQTGIPGQVATLTATPGDTVVDLSWTAPTSTGGGITGYQRMRNIPDWQDSSTMSSAVLSGRLTSFINGVTYTVGVRAWGDQGPGPWRYTTVVPGSAGVTVPGEMTSLTATPGDGVVTLDWTAPASDGGSAITGYVIDWRTYTDGVGGARATLTSPAAATHTYAHTGRTNGGVYGYRIQAVNAIGAGPISTEVMVTLTTSPGATGYLAVVAATSPTHYYPLNSTYTTQDLGTATDVVPTNTGTVLFDATSVNGTSVNSARFSGANYLEWADSEDFSVTKTGELTVMAFLTVDDYDTYDTGEYTHWIGRGASNGGGSASTQEWTGRFYNSAGGSQNRHKRHSAYHYPYPLPSGAQGAGSYAQPDLPGASGANLTAAETATVAVGQEHVVIFQYWTTGTGSFPGGIKIFFNGRETDTDTMAGYSVIPTWRHEPMRLGRREAGGSSGKLKGRVRRLGIWNRLLSDTEIATLTSTANRALTEGTP